jgi:hypothetical protein
MPELDALRAEIRAWLDANCPAEMREPVRDEDDVCWGGRKFVFKNEAQKQAWIAIHAREHENAEQALGGGA